MMETEKEKQTIIKKIASRGGRGKNKEVSKKPSQKGLSDQWTLWKNEMRGKCQGLHRHRPKSQANLRMDFKHLASDNPWGIPILRASHTRLILFPFSIKFQN